VPTAIDIITTWPDVSVIMTCVCGWRVEGGRSVCMYVCVCGSVCACGIVMCVCLYVRGIVMCVRVCVCVCVCVCVVL
jgi:hypothetical protein